MNVGHIGNVELLLKRTKTDDNVVDAIMSTNSNLGSRKFDTRIGEGQTGLAIKDHGWWLKRLLLLSGETRKSRELQSPDRPCGSLTHQWASKLKSSTRRLDHSWTITKQSCVIVTYVHDHLPFYHLYSFSWKHTHTFLMQFIQKTLSTDQRTFQQAMFH